MTEQPGKKISDLTDNELDTYAGQMEAIVQGLSDLNPDHLTPPQQQEREQALEESVNLGERLALEQINRGMQQLRDIVARTKAKADRQEGSDL